MHEGEVHLFHAQFAQAFLQAGHQAVGTEVTGPDFGGDEQLLARDAGFGDGLADFRFVVVDLRGVDVTIAEIQAHLHRIDDLLILEAKGAEAECGDGH